MLKRTNVTHTSNLATALQIGRAAWPEIAASDSAVLTRLAQLGGETLRAERLHRLAALDTAAAEANAAWGHLYDDDYLVNLRAGWPA